MSESRFQALKICEKCYESLCDNCKKHLKGIDDYLNHIETQLQKALVIVERVEDDLRALRLLHKS